MEQSPSRRSDPPIVSIVIPTYNQPALLLETLGSVFAQTFTDYEVIVVDDGSTDDTLERLRPLREQQGDRLRVVSQPNAGTGAARNRGVDEARGKYVALLDHDDLWMPGKLAAQVRFLDAHPACAAAVVPLASSRDPGRSLLDPDEVAGPDGVIPRPMRQAGVQRRPLFLTCSVLMFDRERARGLRFATVRGAIEDVPFQIGLMGRGKLGLAGREVLAVYREHEANASKQASYYYAGLRLLRRMERDGRFDDLSPEQRSDMRTWLAFLGRAAAVVQLLLGRRWRGIETYAREFRHQCRDRRMNFVLGYPAMALAPRRVVHWWAHRRRT